MSERVYDIRELAESAARFVKGIVFPVKSLVSEHFVQENRINPDGFIVIHPLPDWLTGGE